MNSSTLEHEPVAVDVTLATQRLTIDLADGRRISVPLEWYPRLQNASKSERQNWQLIGAGYAIEWPDLDEHIGVESVLAGHRSGESERSLKTWLAERADRRKKTRAFSSKTKQTKKKAISS